MADAQSNRSADATFNEVKFPAFEWHPPRAVAADQGWHWLVEGMNYFKKAPSTWLGIVAVGLAIVVLSSLIPFGDSLLSFSLHFWIAGLMLGSKALHDGKTLTISHLFKGFQQAFMPLLALSAIIAVLNFAIVALVLGSELNQLQSIKAGALSFSEVDLVGVLFKFCIALLFLAPVFMLSWFAPALIVLHKVPVFKAMTLSFKACAINILPFTVYSLLAMLMIIVALIPFALGLLIALPVVYAAMFVSYKDIFVD
jgi:hypothetical protein